MAGAAAPLQKKNQVVFIAKKKKNLVLRRVFFTDSKWGSDFTIQNRNGARSSTFVCLMFPIPNVHIINL
jgi:hypothetical protein